MAYENTSGEVLQTMEIRVFHYLILNFTTKTSSITKISAVCGEVVFNEFAIPKEPVSDEAEAVTGISFDFHSNQMTQHGVEKEHKHIIDVLLDFIDF